MSMKKNIQFVIEFPANKSIIFSSKTKGLKIGRKEFTAKDDVVLIYDKVSDIKADEVSCQLSTNTSTLIPALKVLDLPYNAYFDTPPVVKSQNDITFYSQPSYLAAFYNRYSTDGVEMEKREFLIRSAIQFLITSKDIPIEKLLKKEFLNTLKEECILLGFFEGFPIFDATRGMPMLKSRLGIHIGLESVMISTPLDKYADDVKEVAGKLAEKSGSPPTYKKNRVRFEKTKRLLSTLGV
jgi:hypothetical protein